jgi:hypothetical protein
MTFSKSRALYIPAQEVLTSGVRYGCINQKITSVASRKQNLLISSRYTLHDLLYTKGSHTKQNLRLLCSIYGLINDALSVSYYTPISSNDNLISE